MKPNPQWYYDVAKKLIEASKKVDDDLVALDGKLNVAQSAGTYSTGGPRWATFYDQAASDTFELSSLSAMAARELGEDIHESGLALAHAENASSGGEGAQDPTPTVPTNGTTITMARHPKERSSGATEENPEHWELLDGYLKKQWANCNEGKIQSAGTAFGEYATSRTNVAVTLWNDVTHIFTPELDNEKTGAPGVPGMLDEVAAVCRGINTSGTTLATNVASACKQFHFTAAADKKGVKDALKLLWMLLQIFDINKKIADRLPKGSKEAKAAIDATVEAMKKDFADKIDKALQAISDKVGEIADSGKGVYNVSSEASRDLTNILGFEPRQTHPVRNTDGTDNNARGEEGEIRAGVDRSKQRRVTVVYNGQNSTVVPDLIDDQNRQVVEVKNQNDISDSRDVEQIKKELEYAKQHGYTMTLIIDHRTQIKNADIKALVDSGQIQVTRQLLDENNKE